MGVQDTEKTDKTEEDRPQTDQPEAEDDRQPTEKPEPDEEDKKKAAEMMTAYEDRPTLVLPGSAAMVTGTAVNDWLDEDGNPKCEEPEGGSSDGKAAADEGRDEQAQQEQIEKDKALNEELKEAAAEENKGEKRPTSK
jgi:hypothetical protein